tara:strand:+ start:2205 stop:3146 length:942 start_codon:yes stop_codon:yes gene_type:complete
MPRNVYFSQGTSSEQNLYEDITIEALKIYGHEAYYIPRKIVNEDKIFDEDQLSSFGSSYMIEAYIANTEGYEGEGDLLSKFGLEIRDQITLVIANRRWEQLIGRHINSDTTLDRKVVRRPLEGDLIYLPFVKGLFEIQFVESEDPFYQLQNLPTFQLKCELFEFSGEDIDTGVEAIDTYETQFATRTLLGLGAGTGTFEIGEDVTQTQDGGITISGEVASYDSPILSVYGMSSRSDDTPTGFAVTGGDIGNIIGTDSEASYAITDLTPESSDSPFAAMDDNDDDALNQEFETVGNNFIDFSDGNPFGLPNVVT